MVNFIESISKIDISACRLIIKDFIAQLPGEPASRNPLLLSMIQRKGIHYDQEVLLDPIKELPQEINKAVFLRLKSLLDLTLIDLLPEASVPLSNQREYPWLSSAKEKKIVSSLCENSLKIAARIVPCYLTSSNSAH